MKPGPPTLAFHRRLWELAGYLNPKLEPAAGGSFDRRTVMAQCRAATGRAPNWDSPQTYVEKMSWQKLFHKNPLVNACSDKVQMRSYVRHCGLQDWLVPDVLVFSDPRKIRWDQLPEKFVAKPNHGSQMVLFCRDRAAFCPGETTRRLGRWLRRNYSLRYAETNYRGIQRQITVEPLLDAAVPLKEYKFFCFHGEPKFVVAMLGRFNGRLVRQFHDMDWKPLAMGSRGVDLTPAVVPKPECFTQMASAAARLSADLMHVRVDFLVVDDRPYIGELTFYNFAGVRPFEPEPIERWVGEMWDLNRSAEIEARGRTVVENLTS